MIKPGDKNALQAALISAIENDVYRIAKSKEAFKTAKEKFSIEHHIDELVRIYEEIKK